MTTTPLPPPMPWLGAHVAALETRCADLEAEVARLREALQNLLNDTQHAEHPDCDDGPCPVREARAALKETP